MAHTTLLSLLCTPNNQIAGPAKITQQSVEHGELGERKGIARMQIMRRPALVSATKEIKSGRGHDTRHRALHRIDRSARIPKLF